jgi:RNA cap guanine-N2 methyltransferase
VFALTQRNLRIVGASLRVLRGDFAEHLHEVSFASATPLVFVVSPPWGGGFDYSAGLDFAERSLLSTPSPSSSAGRSSSGISS